MPVYRAGPSGRGSPSIIGVISGATTLDSSKSQQDDFDGDETETMGYIEPSFYPEYFLSIEFDPSSPAKFKKVRVTNADYSPKFIAASSLIKGKKIKYEPTGPNSNSYAMSLIKYAKLPLKKPGVWAPGDGMYLI